MLRNLYHLSHKSINQNNIPGKIDQLNYNAEPNATRNEAGSQNLQETGTSPPQDDNVYQKSKGFNNLNINTDTS